MHVARRVRQRKGDSTSRGTNLVDFTTLPYRSWSESLCGSVDFTSEGVFVTHKDPDRQ